jgi:xanthine phosphoribosyltransferase
MKYFYKYEEFYNDMQILSKKIADYKPDVILPLARGGLSMGHFLAEMLDIRDVSVINSIHYDKDKKLNSLEIFNIPDLTKYKKAIIVDDISDSGDTLKAVISKLNTLYPHLEIKSATIFYKLTSKVIPDFKLKKADKWIVFFWEKM